MISKRLTPSMTALQCFEAAARHLSFTRAAEELHLTQSAVSKQVAQLEEMLCHNLFERVRQRLYLSPAGSLYLAEVHKILTQVDISSRYILTYGGETEVLRIATQPTFGDRWLVPKLKDFAAKHPNIHLDVRNELEPFDVLQAKADIAFFFGQGSWPGATCLELFREAVVPVCAPGFVADGSDASSHHTLLQCTSRPEAWHEWFLEQGLHSQNSYHGPRFDTFYMCIRAAQSGYGVALVPQYLVADELAQGSLMIPWNYAMPSSGAHFIAHAEHAGEIPKVKAFLNWMVEYVGTHPDFQS